MTATEWLALPDGTLWTYADAAEFFQETKLYPNCTARILKTWMYCKDKHLRLHNFGSRKRPQVSKGNLMTILARRTDLSIERRANGSFRINMENMQHGRAA